jgi:hypothetical protein
VEIKIFVSLFNRENNFSSNKSFWTFTGSVFTKFDVLHQLELVLELVAAVGTRKVLQVRLAVEPVGVIGKVCGKTSFFISF